MRTVKAEWKGNTGALTGITKGKVYLLDIEYVTSGIEATVTLNGQIITFAYATAEGFAKSWKVVK